MARAQVNEMGAGCKLAGHLHHIIVGSGRQAACTEGKPVVLVGNGIQEPFNIFLCAHDAWQAQHLDRRIVRVYAHVHIAFLARRHNSFQEVFHVFAKLLFADALIELQEVAELLDGGLVGLREVARDESLCLDNDVLYQLVILFGSHRLGQLVGFGQHVASLTDARRKFKLSPFLACACALEYIDVEIGKLGIVEVEVCRSVRILVSQIGACPVQYGHEVVAYRVYALCRQVAKRLLVHLNLLVAVWTGILDGLHYGEAFYHAPTHAVRLDIFAQLTNLLACPYLA